MSFKMVKLYRKNHEKLDECRRLDNTYGYGNEMSYNDMVGHLADFYIDFYAAGGRVSRQRWGRRTEHHRWTEFTYGEPEGPTREEMGCA